MVYLDLSSYSSIVIYSLVFASGVTAYDSDSYNTISTPVLYDLKTNYSSTYTQIEPYLTETTTSALQDYIDGIPCFHEDTNILCLSINLEEKNVLVKDIKPGMIVKSYKHGYRRVTLVGKQTIVNPFENTDPRNKLFKCKKSNYPELFEDLIITGGHSLLVDDMTEYQKNKTIEIIGELFITDDKYRLFTCLDPKAEEYMEKGSFDVYHIVLENDFYYGNYGIWANGLLVESCSEQFMRDRSNMEY